MQDNIVKFPGRDVAPVAALPVLGGERDWGPGRSRSAVQRDIDAHISARKAYARAVAWEAAAQDEELLPDKIEDARQHTVDAHREMQEAARNLLICMPTDPKGLIDVLMYLEKNFSVLPQEVFSSHNGGGQSLAFYLLRTVRLSLRQAFKREGPHNGPTS